MSSTFLLSISRKKMLTAKTFRASKTAQFPSRCRLVGERVENIFVRTVSLRPLCSTKGDHRYLDQIMCARNRKRTNKELCLQLMWSTLTYDFSETWSWIYGIVVGEYFCSNLFSRDPEETAIFDTDGSENFVAIFFQARSIHGELLCQSERQHLQKCRSAHICLWCWE